MMTMINDEINNQVFKNIYSFILIRLLKHLLSAIVVVS